MLRSGNVERFAPAGFRLVEQRASQLILCLSIVHAKYIGKIHNKKNAPAGDASGRLAFLAESSSIERCGLNILEHRRPLSASHLLRSFRKSRKRYHGK